jgi:hypothetical protein
MDPYPTKNGIPKVKKVKQIEIEKTIFWETILLLTIKGKILKGIKF